MPRVQFLSREFKLKKSKIFFFCLVPASSILPFDLFVSESGP